MLKEFNSEHFAEGSAAALLVLRQSIRNRDVRDFLYLGGPYVRCGSFRELTGGEGSFTVETRHIIQNSTERNSGREMTEAGVTRLLCDSMDFRELCRIFGERYAAVSFFEIRTEFSFREIEGKRNRPYTADHVLSYMRVEIICERVFEDVRTAFFELVRYRGGDNYDLYWDGFPDIDLNFTNGRAKGCNVYMRSLAVYDIQSDGVPKEVHFRAILPVLISFSRIAAGQFDYILPINEAAGENCDKDVRCIWADPEGRICYSSWKEGVAAWLNFFEQKEAAGSNYLLKNIIFAAPGTTLILPSMCLGTGDRLFLQKQRAVFKDCILINEN